MYKNIPLIILILINFSNIYNINWYNDYFNTIANTCKKYKKNFELETYRYNVYDFLNKNKFYIYNAKFNFYITYIIIIAIIIIWLIYNIILNISKNQNSYANILIDYANIDYANIIIENIENIIIIIFLLLYIIIGINIILNLSKLELLISDDKNNTYKNVYEILNAILYINNEEKTVFKYEKENMRKNSTFDKQFENNISVINNTSKISDMKLIKKNAYNSLDFLKYFMLNKSSQYNLEFFNNIYILIKGKDYDEKIYINDYDKDDIVYRKLNTLIYKLIEKKDVLNEDIFNKINNNKNFTSLNVHNIKQYIDLIDNIENKNFITNSIEDDTKNVPDALEEDLDNKIISKLNVFDLLVNDIDIVINPDKYKKYKKDEFIIKFKKYLYTNKILFFSYLTLIFIVILILLHNVFIMINSQLYYMFLIILFIIIFSIVYLTNLNS